ncbi:TonB-dependent receptor SusC [Polaribacter huanghezhanensis]|uniref:TonB-dependent receptor n=1 Tax=Polaribacter huanghezhanensis TaxID=1354726 RepID=UPI0026489B9E|nr:carboxypeptidase-like regulatory domain-containing protein [Polaribacter huanghezhanensis]WKD85517.1 TonB-dependent receptor SusC [Polaribacter huanghezhanensis]
MLKKTFFSCYFLFVIGVIFAQNQSQKISLVEILSSIEKQQDVKFSYNSNLIKNVLCFPFKNEKTLTEKLENLSKQTYLNFNQIDARYIVIAEKEITKNHTISGTLINAKNKEVASFSSVIIKGTTRGTTADENGKFILDTVSSNQQIVIQSVGFNSVTIPAYQFINQPNLTIELVEDNIHLEEVLISDYITQGISKKQDGAIEVSPKKLGILPGLIEPDVLLSLQLLPGIQSPSETASGLQIRGSSPDQNLVLFDGIKMYQSGHFFGLISSFNPYVTKKITLYRNGTNAKYGDRIGGVLDISSGDDVPTFEAGFGVNLTHADAFVKTPLFKNKAGLVFSVRRSITDLVETITYKNFSESVFQNTRILDGAVNDPNKLSNVKNNFYFQDYNLKFIADISEKSKLSISNLFNKNQLEFSSESLRFREKIADNITYQNKGTRILLSHKSSNKFLQNIDFHSSGYKFDYFGNREETRNNANDNRKRNFEIVNHVNDNGINYDFTYNLNPDFQFSGGYQFSKTTIFYIYKTNFNTQNNLLLSTENSSNITNALFSEIKYGNGCSFISFGIRANHFSSAKEWFFEPRIFASTKLSETITLKTSAEIKNQAVSQIIEYRNNGIGLDNDIWAVANNAIPILSSRQLGIGFLYQKNGWNLDVDFYKKKVKGQTLMTDDIASNTKRSQVPFYISGESDITGIEVLLKKRFDNYRSWISYSYANTKQQFIELNNGNSFNGINGIPHSFTWSHTYKLNQFEFSLGWKLRSGIPYTEATGTYKDQNNNLRVSYGSVNEKRLPNYQKFDFSSTYKFNFSKKKKVEGKIGLSLTNIFNRKNILDRKYELKVVNSQGNVEKQKLVKTDRLSLGFTPNLVFRLTF